MIIKNILPGKEGLNFFHNRIINFVSSHSSNHPPFFKDSFKLRSKAAKMFSWGLKNFWVTYCSNIVPINASEHFMISVSSKFLKIDGSSAIGLSMSSRGKFSIVAILKIFKLSLFVSEVWPDWDLIWYWA